MPPPAETADPLRKAGGDPAHRWSTDGADPYFGSGSSVQSSSTATAKRRKSE